MKEVIEALKSQQKEAIDNLKNFSDELRGLIDSESWAEIIDSTGYVAAAVSLYLQATDLLEKFDKFK